MGDGFLVIDLVKTDGSYLEEAGEKMKNIEIYTTPTCPYCVAAKRLLNEKKKDFTEFNVSGDPGKREEMMSRANGRRTVPQIFIEDEHIGGADDLYQLDAEGQLDTLLS